MDSLARWPTLELDRGGCVVDYDRTNLLAVLDSLVVWLMLGAISETVQQATCRFMSAIIITVADTKRTKQQTDTRSDCRCRLAYWRGRHAGYGTNKIDQPTN